MFQKGSLLITVFISVISWHVKAIDIDFVFRHLTLEDGLSNSNVNCITQDSTGFIWIGTENGLNRYDGYNFTHYYNDANKPNSIYSNEILTMLVDSKGILWVGTFEGLFRYNAIFDNFEYIRLDTSNHTQANIQVYAILEDKNDVLWVGTSGNGLFKYDERKGEIINYKHDAGVPNSLSSNYIFKLYKDSRDRLWIGTIDNGLDRFDTKNLRFYNYKPIENVENLQNVNAVLEIFENSDSTFLVGTRGDGLFLFNHHTKKFRPYEFLLTNNEKARPKEIYSIYADRSQRFWISAHGKGLYCFVPGSTKAQRVEHINNVNSSLINNNCRTVFEDRQGNLWIASYQGGINVLPNMYKKFRSFNLYDASSDYVSTTVTSICVDKTGNQWVGTDGAGLKFVDNRSGKVTHFYPGNNVSHFIPDKVIISLMLENDSKLWIGTYLGGLSVYDTYKKTFKNYKTSEMPGALSCNFVSCILKTVKGDIWIGTNGGGINKYNKETDDFTTYSSSDTVLDNQLVNKYVNVLAEDNNGRLWIGTFWGLSVFDPLNGLFFNYLRDEERPSSLSNNTVYCIKITSKNEIWIGTRSGLNRFVPEQNAFQSFNLADGLPGNVIYAIEEDDAGTLWLSTNNGLCSFNPETHEIRSYYESDGLLSNEFFRNASFKDFKGELYFGSINGLNSFNPANVDENYAIPTPIITQFRIFDQVIHPGDKLDNQVILSRPVYLSDTVVLKHRFNSFAFEFVAMDYLLPGKNIYKVKMEGFDQEWRTLASDHRYVTYTNLDAGTYKFMVKASSIDNKWNKKASSVTLVVKPPVYRTWWAYSIYYLLLMGLVLFFWLLSIRRVKLKNEIKLERLDKEKANEINQAKLRFFTNISHEFRTPITLIVGPLEKMLHDKQISKKYRHTIQLMIKNANRLLRLINQIMDLRRIENGQMKLKAEKSDIIYFLKEIFTTFEDLAEQKKIDYRFLTEIDNLVCWFDPDKIDKIVFNLLSNAFKFTPDNGEIDLMVEKAQKPDHSQWIKISVIDTGKGIAEKDKPRIFDRFYQTGDPEQNYSMGSGVGLSLTHSLVAQHYGEITFNSTAGKGTEFRVLLPLDDSVYSNEEKFSPEVPGVKKYVHNLPDDVVEDEINIELTEEKGQVILIVEDNYDLRKYLVNELKEYFDIREAENGKEALAIALDELPDLIISDVLMPEMDGLELTRRVKENFLTNHIPVVLLTARASIEHRIRGIEQGADSYIPKPFNPAHLKIRVKKLLELRQVLRQKYAKELSTPGASISIDEDSYLKELHKFVLDNLDKPDLNIENICREMGISRAHFYRKIKLLTDKSPTEFVRIIRLNEAAKLLSTNTRSISEVCYQVGFNSPSYFSICFKEHFNISPVDFVKKSKKR